MDDCVIFTCVDFWKDVKKLSRHVKASLLECELSPEEFEKLTTEEKISAIPILRQISNTIRNKFSAPHEIPNNEKNGQQPFLSEDWVIWKMRWAVDNRGSRYGLRVMYCINDRHIILSAIKHKKEIKDSENEFQKEIVDRLRIFLVYSFSESE